MISEAQIDAVADLTPSAPTSRSNRRRSRRRRSARRSTAAWASAPSPAGSTSTPADKIVTLQTLDPIHVDFNLPQRQLPRRSGSASGCCSSDAGGGAIEGKIAAISPLVDATTRNAGRGDRPGPEEDAAAGHVRARRYRQRRAKPYLTLPQTAITYNPYGSTVFVVESGEADRQADSSRPARRGDQVAVTSGIEEGQQFGRSGQQTEERHRSEDRQQRVAGGRKPAKALGVNTSRRDSPMFVRRWTAPRNEDHRRAGAVAVSGCARSTACR
ncbi:MAG: hypothetical protein M9915_02965 [Rhizobacter sp.]|nr:hypothetical protein [Rhizobacter sp.]